MTPTSCTRPSSAFDRRPAVGAVQGRLRRLSAPGERAETLDTTGLQMQRDRRVVSRAQGELDGSAHLAPGPIFGADGPAPVYRRAALLDARLPASNGGWEILDEDFFMYKEDVDLAWRLQLLGWTAWYEPKALGWHARGAGGPRARTLVEIARTNNAIPRWVKAMSWRNQRLMQVKNELPSMYLRDLPWILRRELLSLAFIVVADPTAPGGCARIHSGAAGRHAQAAIPPAAAAGQRNRSSRLVPGSLITGMPTASDKRRPRPNSRSAVTRSPRAKRSVSRGNRYTDVAATTTSRYVSDRAAMG